MSKNQRTLWLIGTAEVIGLLVVLGVHFVTVHNQRADIIKRYSTVELPAILTHAGHMEGCDGLDFNDCWTYSYTVPASEAGGLNSLQTSLKQDGFIVYTGSAGSDTGFIAQSSVRNLDLFVAPDENSIDITVQDLTP